MLLAAVAAVPVLMRLRPQTLENFLIPSNDIVLRNAYWVVNGEPVYINRIPEWRLRLPAGLRRQHERGLNGGIGDRVHQNEGKNSTFFTSLTLELVPDTLAIQQGGVRTGLDRTPPPPWIDIYLSFSNQPIGIHIIGTDFCMGESRFAELNSGKKSTDNQEKVRIPPFPFTIMNYHGWEVRFSAAAKLVEDPEPLCAVVKNILHSWTISIDDLRAPSTNK